MVVVKEVHFEWRQSACSEIFSFTLLRYFFFFFFFAGIIIIMKAEDYAAYFVYNILRDV